jgi:hypothetical protein
MKSHRLAGAALAGAGVVAVMLVTQAARTTPPTTAPSAGAASLPLDHEVAADVARDVRRFALNALLVPLLDPERSPARWQDPSLAMHCEPGTQVLVDGRPIEPRAESHDRAFSVQWSMTDCLPFGPDGPVWSGRADLVVFRDDVGLAAIVHLTDLRVRHRAQAIVVNDIFVSHTP